MLLSHPSDAEIEQLRVTVGHYHNISGLDVRMNDAATMSVVQCICYLTYDAKCRVIIDDGGILRVENIGKCAAIQPFHDQEIEIVVTIEVKKAHNIRVYQAAPFGRFLLQRTQRLPVLCQLWRQDL